MPGRKPGRGGRRSDEPPPLLNKRPHAGIAGFLTYGIFQITLLKYATLDLNTLNLYTSTIQKFVDFVSERMDSEHHCMDVWAALYTVYVYQTGGGVHGGDLVIASLLFFLPEMKGKLYEATRAIAGFRILKPPRGRLPMSLFMLFAIVHFFLLENTARSDEFATGTWYLWEVCGRMQDMRQLCNSDVIFSHSLVAFQLAPSHRGARTKTESDLGAVSRSQGLIFLLKRLIARKTSARQRRPDAPFFSFSSRDFSKAFKRAQCSLKWSKYFPPHCIRHGRASHEAGSGRSARDIDDLGRWKRGSSAARGYRKPHAIPVSESFATSDSLRLGSDFSRSAEKYIHDIFSERLTQP